MSAVQIAAATCRLVVSAVWKCATVAWVIGVFVAHVGKAH